ncbi:ATP-grasp domain-containing protein [Candidatus Parcubacteria bacterium]|nr:ATP-grasp domain-containing protein [Candidatus Parcubacteria bacterium]
MTPKTEKNIILFVGTAIKKYVEGVRAYEKKHGTTYRIALIRDKRKEMSQSQKDMLKHIDIVIQCNILSEKKLEEAILPYKNNILSVVARGDNRIPLLTRIIPYVPKLKYPSLESIHASTDKILMRQKLSKHDRKLSPPFMVVSDMQKDTIQKIKKRVGFPLVVKPSGLSSSKLVTICFHKEELEQALKRVFKKLNGVNKKNKEKKQKVLVEQFMDGLMYSVDCYVTGRETIYFCPMVHIKTGNDIGFDDFFGYRQMTPTLLNKKNIEKAHTVSKQAIKALKLKNTSVHIELFKTEGGWKIIELTPRLGGLRHAMYQLSYGIDHNMNDIFMHVPKKPFVPKKRKGYTAALKFFAKKEGRLTKLTGIKKAQKLESLHEIMINKKIGSRCRYAKNGGGSVFNIILFNENRSKLLADIRRLEKMIDIQTKKPYDSK